MALKGTGKTQSTCFTSATDRSQKSLITEPWHLDEVRGIFFFFALMLESQVLYWSLKQSSFILVSHCCHLPLSVHVWHSWKDFPCCHDNVATTVEGPYSLSPMCHAVYLWSGVDYEGMRIGARSLKNWSCVISFPWDHVWVMKLFEMLEWWYQWSLIQRRNKPMTQESLNKILTTFFFILVYIWVYYLWQYYLRICV